jgi:serine/threonine protein kinase/Tol biopolymer transport system component
MRASLALLQAPRAFSLPFLEKSCRGSTPDVALNNRSRLLRSKAVKTLDKIRKIFSEAIEKQTQQEREAYLDEVCRDHPSLRAEIDALLEAHYGQDDLLSGPILGSPATPPDSALSESPGTIIDKYKLLEQIGEGGMAVVYMAEQEKPIRRKVALKIIKLGMDTKQVIARFEAERQALAMMDHPNIAKVLDAGATETGRPYFVMELVTGVSITKYCDKNNLSTKERLALFIQVCSAVQHAHQKGIIHRDIKPTNVMVTQHEGAPVPKVIDFGIAKATNQKLTEKTLFTRYAHIIGTPAYMSPEQADMSDLDVDTRSDIYSLGVLLYELLTGTTPFSEEELRKAGYLEMQRVIREQRPPKPSTKLSTLGQTLTDIAKYRGCTPDLLTKAIRDDLDWIVMKALEKSRDRRYDNAAALATDVRRHLSDQPILARAPKFTYRLQKFLRRHRYQTITSLTIAVLIAAVLIIYSMWNLNRRQLAKAESLKAEADFLKDEKILSQARECFSRRDLTAALTTVESILNSEHVGPEARLLCANIYLYRAEHYHYLGDEDNVVRDMERYVNILDPLEATDRGNRRLKDMLIGLWRGTPENLGSIVNSSACDWCPSISADGRELYFDSNRSGDYDIWFTTRATKDDDWGTPVNLGSPVNGPFWDQRPCISANGRMLFFCSLRSGGWDIWVTTRATTDDSWDTPVSLGSPVNSPALDIAPNMSLDGRSLFFGSDRPGGYGSADLWLTTRETIHDDWGTPVNLGPAVNSVVNEGAASISADGRALFLSGAAYGPFMPDGHGNSDLWVATRARRDDDWGTPVNLGPNVNSPYYELTPSISMDGSTLYFASNRDGGVGDSDLWQVSITPTLESPQKDGSLDSIQESVDSDNGKEVVPASKQ